MCIAVFMWEAHPLYSFLLFFNRDENYKRPTKPMGWWEGGRDILGGRDEVAGGTWLACSRRGRLAFVTNVLEPTNPGRLSKPKSKGALPILFLESEKSPKEFGNELAKEAHQYNGFNLIVADMTTKTKSMVYISNRPKGEPVTVQEVTPGIHVLTNAKLDTPWPKARRLLASFEREIGQGEIREREMVEKLMKDREKANVEDLPHICALDWEHSLSSIFVEVDTPLGMGGTRSTAVVSVKKADGVTTFYETYIDRGNDDNNVIVWKEHSLNFTVQQDQIISYHIRSAM